MAEVQEQTVDVFGHSPTYQAADVNGDTIPILSHGAGVTHFVHVKNGGGASITFNVQDPNSVGPPGAQAFDPDLGVTVPAGGEVMVGINPVWRFMSQNGEVGLAYSDVTSVTVAAFIVS